MEENNDLKLLIECLKLNRHDFTYQEQSLKTIASLCQTSDDASNYLVHSDALQYILKIIFKPISPHSLKVACLHVLCSACENNALVQNVLCKENVFLMLKKFLTVKSHTKLQTLSAYLVICLVSNNERGQVLARTSKTLETLRYISKDVCSPTCSPSNPKRMLECFAADSEGKTELINLWQTAMNALSVCVNNPQNKENQFYCSSVFPAAVAYLRNSQSSLIQTTTLTLLTNCLINNNRTQVSFRLIGGLRVLCDVMREELYTDNQVPSSVLSTLVMTLEAAVCRNAISRSSSAELETIPLLLRCLQLCFATPKFKLECLMSIASCIEGCAANCEAFLLNQGIAIVIKLLAENQNCEELQKTATCVLHTYMEQTKSLDSQSMDEILTSKGLHVSLTQIVKPHNCSTPRTLVEADGERTDVNDIGKNKVIHNKDSLKESISLVNDDTIDNQCTGSMVNQIKDLTDEVRGLKQLVTKKANDFSAYIRNDVEQNVMDVINNVWSPDVMPVSVAEDEMKELHPSSNGTTSSKMKELGTGRSTSTARNMEELHPSSKGETSSKMRESQTSSNGTTSSKMKESQISSNDATSSKMKESQTSSNGTTSSKMKESQISSNGTTSSKMKESQTSSNGTTSSKMKESQISSNDATSSKMKESQTSSNGTTSSKMKESQTSSNDETSREMKELDTGHNTRTARNMEELHPSSKGETSSKMKELQTNSNGGTSREMKELDTGRSTSTARNMEELHPSSNGRTSSKMKESQASSNGGTSREMKELDTGHNTRTARNMKELVPSINGETSRKWKKIDPDHSTSTARNMKEFDPSINGGTSSKMKELNLSGNGKTTISNVRKPQVKSTNTGRDTNGLHPGSNTSAGNKMKDLHRSSNGETASKMKGLRPQTTVGNVKDLLFNKNTNTARDMKDLHSRSNGDIASKMEKPPPKSTESDVKKQQGKSNTNTGRKMKDTRSGSNTNTARDMNDLHSSVNGETACKVKELHPKTTVSSVKKLQVRDNTNTARNVKKEPYARNNGETASKLKGPHPKTTGSSNVKKLQVRNNTNTGGKMNESHSNTNDESEIASKMKDPKITESNVKKQVRNAINTARDMKELQASHSANTTNNMKELHTSANINAFSNMKQPRLNNKTNTANNSNTQCKQSTNLTTEASPTAANSNDTSHSKTHCVRQEVTATGADRAIQSNCEQLLQCFDSFNLDTCDDCLTESDVLHHNSNVKNEVKPTSETPGSSSSKVFFEKISDDEDDEDNMFDGAILAEAQYGETSNTQATVSNDIRANKRSRAMMEKRDLSHPSKRPFRVPLTGNNELGDISDSFVEATTSESSDEEAPLKRMNNCFEAFFKRRKISSNVNHTRLLPQISKSKIKMSAKCLGCNLDFNKVNSRNMLSTLRTSIHTCAVHRDYLVRVQATINSHKRSLETEKRSPNDFNFVASPRINSQCNKSPAQILKKVKRRPRITNVAKIPFSERDIKTLCEGVREYGEEWTKISENCPFLVERTPKTLKQKFKSIKEGNVSRRKRRLFTDQEERNLKNGVLRYGYRWKKILSKYRFKESRTPQDLKDKWRNMIK